MSVSNADISEWDLNWHTSGTRDMYKMKSTDTTTTWNNCCLDQDALCNSAGQLRKNIAYSTTHGSGLSCL